MLLRQGRTGEYGDDEGMVLKLKASLNGGVLAC